MIEVRKVIFFLVAVTRHLTRVAMAGQTRFRLETFGSYYPHLPYTRRTWQMSPRYVLLFIRRLPSYLRWVDEMEHLRRQGADEWWRDHTGSSRDTP